MNPEKLETPRVIAVTGEAPEGGELMGLPEARAHRLAYVEQPGLLRFSRPTPESWAAATFAAAAPVPNFSFSEYDIFNGPYRWASNIKNAESKNWFRPCLAWNLNTQWML